MSNKPLFLAITSNWQTVTFDEICLTKRLKLQWIKIEAATVPDVVLLYLTVNDTLKNITYRAVRGAPSAGFPILTSHTHRDLIIVEFSEPTLVASIQVQITDISGTQLNLTGAQILLSAD